MFLGEYEHSVDAKGRIAVPAKFRAQLSEGLVVTRGFDHCLQVFPLSTWQTFSQKISETSIGHFDMRQLLRLVFSGAFDTELDKQGRILLPLSLRTYAKIEDQAVISGMNTFFEVWSDSAWASNLETLSEEGQTLAAVMDSLGI